MLPVVQRRKRQVTQVVRQRQHQRVCLGPVQFLCHGLDQHPVHRQPRRARIGQWIGQRLAQSGDAAVQLGRADVDPLAEGAACGGDDDRQVVVVDHVIKADGVRIGAHQRRQRARCAGDLLRCGCSGVSGGPGRQARVQTGDPLAEAVSPLGRLLLQVAQPRLVLRRQRFVPGAALQRIQIVGVRHRIGRQFAVLVVGTPFAGSQVRHGARRVAAADQL